MVTPVSSFGRSGLSDWVIQRLSALVLLAYVLFVVGIFIFTPELDYLRWQTIFSATWVKGFTMVALLSLSAHAWIGLWTIATDYFTNRLLGRTGTILRSLFMLGSLGILITYFFWCIRILWGN